MANLEKVKKALEHHKETIVCNGCPYAGDDDTPQGYCPVYDDALELLREQEPVEPGEMKGVWFCGKCGQTFYGTYVYCPRCGRAVKWDDA